MKISLVLLSFLILSCAQKMAPSCPDGKDVMREYLSKRVPEEFKVYGYLYYGLLRVPVMLAKSEGSYTVKVAKIKGVSLEDGRFCVGERCYPLPVSPEDLVFGRVLSGREAFLCEDGNLVFQEETGSYTKRAIFEGRKLRELTFWDATMERKVKISFRDEDERGFFREIDFNMGELEVKLQIEEVKS